MELVAFGNLRPFLYHLTARENIEHIRHVRRLESAAVLARRAGQADLLEKRRSGHVAVHVDGTTVLLRDQAPLHSANMQLEPGWTFDRFVRCLNERVFFWPGREDGPIPHGLRHFGRYEAEKPVILRVPFDGLRRANPGFKPLFCRYNSGSPRWSRGVAAPRGAATFVRADDASFGPAQVVEVTALHGVDLPAETMCGERPSGPWRLLF
jgi:uncharacterized protein DUF7002